MKLLRPKLSICIPTYKRQEKLFKLIANISKQINEANLQEYVELIVSDNDGINTPSEAILALKSVYSELIYHKQNVNIGAEGNFKFLAISSKGEYVWILGDDDEIENSAIEIIVRYLEANVSDLCVLNHFTKLETENKKNIKYNKDIKKLKNHEDLFVNFNVDLSFISSVIFRRACFHKIDFYAYELLSKSGFSFLYSVYSMALLSENFNFLNKPLFTNIVTKEVSYDWTYYFVDGILDSLDQLRNAGLSHKLYKLGKANILRKYLIPKFTFIKSNGERYAPMFFKISKKYCTSINFWLILLPLFLMPRPLLNIISQLKKIAKIST